MRAAINPEQIPRTRIWRGAPLSPVQEVLMFHDEAGPVPETFRTLCGRLEAEGIEYVVIGGIALSAHQFRRATEDVDLCMRPVDFERFRSRFVGREYQPVQGRRRRFYDPNTQVTFDLLASGELAGRVERNKDIRFPDPSEAREINGIHTVELDRLIALKLVTWRHKDWGDVIELIRRNGLDESFADRLPASVRSSYLQCLDERREEDRYDPTIDPS